jgi:hypothetical protein
MNHIEYAGSDDTADLAKRLAKHFGLKWVAGWNMPGYLPESGPTLFDDWADARAHIVETIDRFWDEDYDTVGLPPIMDRDDPEYKTQDQRQREGRDKADAKWLEIHTQAGLATPNGSWLMANADNSLVFWIVQAQDTEHNIAGGV